MTSNRLVQHHPWKALCIAGRPSRYAYAGVMKHPTSHPQFIGIAKFDLTGKAPGKSVVGQVSFGPNRIGGEAFFVPSHLDTSKCEGERIVSPLC